MPAAVTTVRPIKQVTERLMRYGTSDAGWIRKSAPAMPHYFFPITLMPFGVMRSFYGFAHRVVVTMFVAGEVQWLWNREDCERVRDTFVDRCAVNGKLLGKLSREWLKRVAVLEKELGGFDRHDLSGLTDRALAARYRALLQLYVAEFSIAVAVQDPFSMTAEDFLIPYFQQVFEKLGRAKSWHKDFAVLSHPEHMSVVAEEVVERAAVYRRYQGKGGTHNTTLEQALEKHAAKYHWIRNSYGQVERLLARDFMEMTEKIGGPQKLFTEAKKILQHHSGELTAQKRLSKKLALDRHSQLLLRLTRVFAWQQDRRKGIMQRFVGVQKAFLQEVARRIGCSVAELEWTLPTEFREVLQWKSAQVRRLAVKRQHGVILVPTAKSAGPLLDGPAALRLMISLKLLKSSSTEPVRGVTACKGVARGTVRVVRLPADFKRMQQGDVLVTSMTRPEMVPLMKLAAAIVTDEGGITSHAAVISRELGVPCIIGTRYATTTLTDGDTVEVDANKGIVSVLVTNH